MLGRRWRRAGRRRWRRARQATAHVEPGAGCPTRASHPSRSSPPRREQSVRGGRRHATLPWPTLDPTRPQRPRRRPVSSRRSCAAAACRGCGAGCRRGLRAIQRRRRPAAAPCGGAAAVVWPSAARRRRRWTPRVVLLRGLPRGRGRGRSSRRRPGRARAACIQPGRACANTCHTPSPRGVSWPGRACSLCSYKILPGPGPLRAVPGAGRSCSAAAAAFPQRSASRRGPLAVDVAEERRRAAPAAGGAAACRQLCIG